ncbi:MAG: TRAP transporter small permease subunit [Alphaproteobacteria bacterium]
MVDTIDRAVSWINRTLMMLAAGWLVVLAFVILADVVGRGLFALPVQGTPELVANSVVTIAFLQVCHSIRMGGMLKADLINMFASPRGVRILRVIGYILGVALFLTLAYASWEPMLFSWEIGEFHGEGAMRVPAYPVRTVLVLIGVLAAVNYALLAWREIEVARAA